MKTVMPGEAPEALGKFRPVSGGDLNEGWAADLGIRTRLVVLSRSPLNLPALGSVPEWPRPYSRLSLKANLRKRVSEARSGESGPPPSAETQFLQQSSIFLAAFSVGGANKLCRSRTLCHLWEQYSPCIQRSAVRTAPAVRRPVGPALNRWKWLVKPWRKPRTRASD
jgi:hypothetical protein